MTLTELIKKDELWLEIFLLLVAAIFFSIDINRQLVDYDEATYAQVIVDTLHSNNFLTLQHFGNSWFEKPPLYLWLAMGSVSVFGEHEFAFRIPGIIASVLCCWLVYLIVRETTRDRLAAVIGFLVLLCSNSFFVYAREARLDSAVTASILSALFFYLKGRDDKRYLFWILPCIAIGLLFKSVIALLALLVLLFYSIFLNEWNYVKSKYFWWGAIVAVILWVPWHVIESLRFGRLFWDDYLGKQILLRASTTLTGTNNFYDYFILFLPWYAPWNIVIFVELAAVFFINFFSKSVRDRIPLGDILNPLLIATFIFVLFTLARTHLGPYIMPAFPFFAISIAVGYHYLASVWHAYRYWLGAGISVCILGGIALCVYLMPAEVPPYSFDEREIGRIYKSQNLINTPLYMFDWKAVETVDYYSGTQAKALDPNIIDGKVLHGPFYLAIDPIGVNYFFTPPNTPLSPGLALLYVGRSFALIYSDRDQLIPDFSFKK